MANTEISQLRLSLSEKDSIHLAEISKLLGIKESEVMRKGLQLMSLYAKAKISDSKGSSLIFKTADESTAELMII